MTDVSGRGVGMDVVRKNIEGLRGRVEISSETNKGSVFTIALPLTLAIIDGMIIDVGHEKFIIPTLNIKESLRLSKEQFHRAFDKGESILVRNEMIPIYRLDQMFGVKESNADRSSYLVVIVESAGKQVGLIVDELLGQQQIVIKNLGQLFQDLRGFSGGAIMADGSVGLILDVPTLIAAEQAEKEQSVAVA